MLIEIFGVYIHTTIRSRLHLKKYIYICVLVNDNTIYNWLYSTLIKWLWDYWVRVNYKTCFDIVESELITRLGWQYKNSALIEIKVCDLFQALECQECRSSTHHISIASLHSFIHSFIQLNWKIWNYLFITVYQGLSRLTLQEMQEKLFYSNATVLIFIPIKLIAEIKNFDVGNIPS